MRELIEQLFPRLRESRFEITSAADPRYNCIAGAAGETRRWWWPAESPLAYWPAGVERDESISTFVNAFSTLGYQISSSGDLDLAAEKVAIFAIGNLPTHMARQLPDGTWTSKLGELEDIRHHTAEYVATSDYGVIVLFLERPRSGVPDLET